jgi:hypothetical protein
MHKGTIEITNKGLGLKLINSMSFGESVFSTGFIQKTAKRYLFVKGNIRIPSWHQRSGPAGPWGMPLGLPQSPIELGFQKVPPPPPRVTSTPFLKLV